MRKSITIVLTVLAATALLLAGCDPILPSGGKSVKFTAHSKSQVTTKTVYAGNYDATAESTHEDIYWKDGDNIRIYSSKPDVVATPDGTAYAEYSLDVSNETPTNAELVNDASNGLAWKQSGAVTFYAVYPPSTPGSTVGIFDMGIPTTQAYKVPTETVMDHAYMLATSTLSRMENVSLNFYPAFTAFQINLKSLDDELTLKEFKIFYLDPNDPENEDDIRLSGPYWGGIDADNNMSFLRYPYNDEFSSSFVESGYDFSQFSQFSQVRVAFDGIKVTSGTNGTAVNFTLFTLPFMGGITGDPILSLTNLWLEVTYWKNDSNHTPTGDPITKRLALKQNDEFYQFDACKKYRINGLAVGDSWILDIDGKVLPWNGHDEKVKAQVTLQGKVSISGAIENTYVWQSTVGKELDYPRHRDIDNHYETDGTYSQFYQVRTLNTFNEIAAADRYFLMTFTPTAPTGGYWELVPTFKDGDTESRNHFKFELEERPNAGFKSVEMDELNGPILNSIVKIKIIPKNYDWSDPNTYNIWFKYYCRTSKTSAPISGDSEFQDVHGDGRFSYWTFRLGQYEGDFDPSIPNPDSGN